MAIIYGVLAALFFSMTFVLNQVMAAGGGDWLWTAALRYLWMFPFFLGMVLFGGRQRLTKIWTAIKGNWQSWFLWSQVGFGLFYVPLCFASTLAPGWLVASTWQVTIVAGSLMAPFLEKDRQLKKENRISKGEIFCFGMILLGILLIEVKQLSFENSQNFLLGFVAVLIAAFAYPLGNRKIMQLNHETANLTTAERIFAMILCSMPTWLVCSFVGYVRSGLPNHNQVFSSFLVALFSGVFATYLFFHATQMVHKNRKQLATVEATQSLEVVFSLLLGILFLQDQLPSGVTLLGLFLVVGGMILQVLKK